MSSLVTVLIIGDRVLHCVDHDRPVWLRLGKPGISRAVVPSRNQIIADALVSFASDLFGLGIFAWNLYEVPGRPDGVASAQ